MRYIPPETLEALRSTTPFDATDYDRRFANHLGRIQSELVDILHPQIPPAATQAETLWEAIRYGTLERGKRIRSVLCLESGLACGGDPDCLLPTACAIELVHSQSLIHDDLPSMDNDDLRRGKPTVHRAYGESTAVLAGDALLAMAFGVIARRTPLKGKLTAESLLSVIDSFSAVTGMQGLVHGQFVDILFQDRPYDAAVLEEIHTHKTGALFRFSAWAGALLSGAPESTVSAFDRLGQKLGLAFQIVDDLLDIQSTSESLGKTPGKDVAQGKATYPALYGEVEARRQSERLIVEAEALLTDLANAGMAVDSLHAIATFIGSRIR